jgi:molybdopterin/thiamine biosynthesis adenylyltransferase
VGTVELWDMSSNFVFSENDVGKNRALASVAKLQELNNAVVVQSLTSELTKEQLADFQVSLLLSTLHTHTDIYVCLFACYCLIF